MFGYPVTVSRIVDAIRETAKNFEQEATIRVSISPLAPGALYWLRVPDDLATYRFEMVAPIDSSYDIHAGLDILESFQKPAPISPQSTQSHLIKHRIEGITESTPWASVRIYLMGVAKEDCECCLNAAKKSLEESFADDDEFYVL